MFRRLETVSRGSLVCLGLLLCGCRETLPSESLAPGGWGGDHVALTVATSRTDVTLDCAHGWISGRVRLDGDGRFTAAGVYVREHGGPVRVGEPEDAHPAVYNGSANGIQIAFSITLTDDGTTTGPFLAVRNKAPRLFKCL